MLFKQWPDANWLILAGDGAGVGAGYWCLFQWASFRQAQAGTTGQSWQNREVRGLLATLLICVGEGFTCDWSFASLVLGLLVPHWWC